MILSVDLVKDVESNMLGPPSKNCMVRDIETGECNITFLMPKSQWNLQIYIRLDN